MMDRIPVDTLKQTERICADELEAARRAQPPRGTGLLVYYRDTVRFVPLAPGHPVVIGRDPGAGGVAIDDASLSREHARFLLDRDLVEVTDLNSSNGTWHLGARVGRAEISPGDEVRLSGVPVVVHGAAMLRTSLRPLSHERFRVALEEEAVRARHFRRPFALLMVRSEGGQASVSGFHASVSALLRPVDRLAFYSHDTLEILLPEAGLDEATRVAAGVAAPCRERVPSLLVGVAVHPDMATEPESLMDASLKALRSAGAADRVRVAQSGRRVTDRSGRGTAEEGVVAGAVLRGVFAQADQLARSTLPVLLLGETGVGKEVLAHRIHVQSGRRGKFVAINCGAIPETLVESTLFGYQRGAFTGAARPQEGLFEEADGGTLLLDEVGDLPKASQAALLRVLESRRVRRVGAAAEVDVDVRIIAATHRELEAMAEEGTFRKDLLYRLGGAPLNIPPLRERVEEIRPLIEAFLLMANNANGRAVSGLEARAMALLEAYAWPGNVRELRNAIERAVVLSRSGVITPQELPERVRGGAALPAPPSLPAALACVAPQPAEGDGLKASIQRYEGHLIVEALNACEGNQTAAAARLQVPLRTLVHKMKQRDIKRAPFEASSRRQRKRG